MGLTCPHCGKDITDIIEEELRKMRSAAGKIKTDKKQQAQRSNMEKLNAAYSAEKRKAAALKRLETLRKKKELEG